MISQMHTLTHVTPISHFLDADHRVRTFEGNVYMRDVLEYFSTYAADVVIITEETLHIGIMTLKDMMRSLCDCDNLLRPVREFMSAPLLTFQAIQNVSDVLNVIQTVSHNKIVVMHDSDVMGVLDSRHLLSLCYTQLSSLVKHEYNIMHSMTRLIGEGERELLQMATTDPLTGIGNRRLFEEIVQTHQVLGEHYEASSFLLLFDIDNFKTVNDTLGHNIGDFVLKELVSLVGRSIRKSDVFARWGGEEFVILLRYADSSTVLEVVEEIRKQIDEHGFKSLVHVTCSFGLTPIWPSDSLETCFERADNALYRAKADGKNSIHIEMV